MRKVGWIAAAAGGPRSLRYIGGFTPFVSARTATAVGVPPPSAGSASTKTAAPGTSSARSPAISPTITVCGVTSSVGLAVHVFHAQPAAVAARGVASDGAVGHRAIGQVPSVVTFACTAHRFWKNVDLGRLPAARGVLHGGGADERVAADVGEGLGLYAVDSGHVGDGDSNGAIGGCRDRDGRPVERLDGTPNPDGRSLS